jgi:hypothetical protein
VVKITLNCKKCKTTRLASPCANCEIQVMGSVEKVWKDAVKMWKKGRDDILMVEWAADWVFQ